MPRAVLHLLLALMASEYFTPKAMAWGTGHRIITEAALETMDRQLAARWTRPHVDPHTGKAASISWHVSHRFNLHPDWVDGPSRTGDDLDERVRSKQFVYAEIDGRVLPPITYAGPDRATWKGQRPKTYHYFTFPREELNREFARRGSKWYFEKITEALRKGVDVAAAEYFGAFAHAIQDRVSPVHVWDGFTEEREEFENRLASDGLQAPEKSFRDRPEGPSLFWFVSGKDMMIDVADYQPHSLGATTKEASEALAERLFEERNKATSIYTERDGFVDSRLSENWSENEAGAETSRFLSRIGEASALLTADVLHTAFLLSQKESNNSGEAAP